MLPSPAKKAVKGSARATLWMYNT